MQQQSRDYFSGRLQSLATTCPSGWQTVFPTGITANPIPAPSPIACPMFMPYCPYGSYSVAGSNGCSQTICNPTPGVPTTTLVCTPNWQCGSWSACANSQQVRTCSDSNNCGITTAKPALTQSCPVSTSTALSNDTLSTLTTSAGKEWGVSHHGP